MTTKLPTLTEMRQALSHAVADGSSSPASPSGGDKGSKKSRGKGDFDESKVKRDGDGMFAKKSSSDEDKPSKEDWAKWDKDWRAGKASVERDVTNEAGNAINKIQAKLLSKYNVKDYTKLPKQAVTEGMHQIAASFNEAAKVAGTSPSGTQRLNYTYNEKSGALETNFVDYKSKPEIPGYAKIKTGIVMPPVAPLPESNDGPMFNPSADISGGKVKEAKHTASSPTLSEMRHALASDSSGAPSKGEKKGRGKGNFDETKVKRDGDGQFARKPADSFNPDKDWAANLEDSLDKVIDKVFTTDKSLKMMTEELSKQGITAKTMTLPKNKSKMIAAQDSYIRRAVSLVNDAIRKAPQASVSPSGTQRAEYYTTSNGPGTVAMGLRLVDTKTGKVVKTVMEPSSGKIKHSDVPPTLSEMEAVLFGSTEDVLRHYGIKGMRWGFRRTDAQLATAKIKNAAGEDVGELQPGSSSAAKAMKAMSVGSTMVVDGEDGAQVLTKQADGSFKKAPLSADAERFIKTLNKTPDEMSDAELKAATNRATQLQSYNKLFGADNKSELERRVEALTLQKKYRDLQKELNPPKKTAVQQLITGSAKGFETFKQVDKLLNGDLSGGISSKLGLKPPMSLVDKIKLDSQLTTLRTQNIRDHAAFNRTMATDGRMARGDLPSQATGYASAGKRRARTATEGKRQKNDGFTYRLPN